MDADRLVRVTSSPAFTWWVRHVASWLDPLLFRATNGRLTLDGAAGHANRLLDDLPRPAAPLDSFDQAVAAAATPLSRRVLSP